MTKLSAQHGVSNAGCPRPAPKARVPLGILNRNKNQTKQQTFLEEKTDFLGNFGIKMSVNAVKVPNSSLLGVNVKKQISQFHTTKIGPLLMHVCYQSVLFRSFLHRPSTDQDLGSMMGLLYCLPLFVEINILKYKKLSKTFLILILPIALSKYIYNSINIKEEKINKKMRKRENVIWIILKLVYNISYNSKRYIFFQTKN